MDPSLAILLIAGVYVAFSLGLQKKMGSRDRMKHLQRELNSYQKEFKEAAESNDEKRLKQMQAREKEVHGYMMEMMWLPWKSLIFVLPVFFLLVGTHGFPIPFYDGLLPEWFTSFSIGLPFELHPGKILSGSFPFLQLGSIPVPSTYGPRGYFIVCTVFFGIIGEALVSRLDGKKQAQ